METTVISILRGSDEYTITRAPLQSAIIPSGSPVWGEDGGLPMGYEQGEPITHVWIANKNDNNIVEVSTGSVTFVFHRINRGDYDNA